MKEFITMFLKDKDLKPSSARILAFLTLIAMFAIVFFGFRADPKVHKLALGSLEVFSYLAMVCILSSQGSKAVESLKKVDEAKKEVKDVVDGVKSLQQDGSRFIK